MLWRSFVTASKQIRMSYFNYNYALMRKMPKSFEKEAIRMDETQEVDFVKARQQLDNYKDALTKLGLQVIDLDADEEYPDCIFVEDPAIVIGKKALITRLGHVNRRGETGPIKEVLQNKLQLDITEMKDEDATVDGGDVLFTGKEILVGLSARTNEKGVKTIAETFPEFPVTGIPVHPTVLHLKSIATMLGDGVMAVGGSSAANEMFQAVKNKAKFDYKYVELEKDTSANVLYINGKVVHKTQPELGDHDYKKLLSNISGDRVEVCMDEMYKVDGCLSCCSILINN
ncbi:N(G),N(G)-dimethylarginine dimethylaminohydrolase 1-like [Patella vulgata]|uniref:N(G),N(G)-dimethylarginine dimethylaminohydrolase 1-like n=1 Tax=Patella vulgata TaxID=6465 RepID=UPI0024A8AC2A|nr:N(G),N(G)-dimethylarginine dimethylaminohydrolase 1-like [Patella vulgata]